MIFNLNPRDYDGSHYYMWDAKQQYWLGHEWNKGGDQPAIPQGTRGSTSSNNYPQNNSDPRYYNETDPGYGIRNDAQTDLFKSLLNVNELSWYVMKGDPRWDEDELWTSMGHLYQGGMWFLKKANITDYSAEHSADGITDLRTTFKRYINTPSHTVPSATDANKYFYLPSLGSYRQGKLFTTGYSGLYWTSSAYRDIYAYCIYITPTQAAVYFAERYAGVIAQPFSDFGDN